MGGSAVFIKDFQDHTREGWFSDLSGRAAVILFGQHPIRISGLWRKYLHTCTADVEFLLEVEARLERIDCSDFLDTILLQILLASPPDNDGVATIGCVDMTGTEVATLCVNLQETHVHKLQVEVGNMLGKDPERLQFLFPDGTFSGEAHSHFSLLRLRQDFC